MKKTLLAISLMTLAGQAMASPISWDFSATGGTAASDYPVDKMNFAYNSQSIIIDTDGNGVLSAGDEIVSFGGFGVNGFDAGFGPYGVSPLTGQGYDSIGANFIGSFVPGVPFMTGYGSDYLFTFSFNNFEGVWNGSDFVYNNGGTIDFGVFTFNTSSTGLAAGFTSLFNMNVVNGGPDNSSGQQQQVFSGNLTNLGGDVFSVTHGALTQTIGDWLNVGDVLFKTSQTVAAGLPGVGSEPGDIVFENGFAVIAAQHNGDMTLAVPEPTSLAILGLGLLGLAGSARRRKAK